MNKWPFPRGSPGPSYKGGGKTRFYDWSEGSRGQGGAARWRPQKALASWAEHQGARHDWSSGGAVAKSGGKKGGK